MDEFATRDITVAGDPQVSISGFPFLTQVVSGKYDQIKIKLKSPKISGIQFTGIDLSISGLTADAASVMKGSGEIKAEKVTGTATLGWDAVREVLELSGLPGVEPTDAQVTVADNQLHIRFPLSTTGQSGAVVADGTLQVANGKVKVNLTNVRTEGAVPTAVKQEVARTQTGLVAAINIPDLPFQLVIDSVSSDTTGLTVVASATDVVLASR
jgi:hypothetical protein